MDYFFDFSKLLQTNAKPEPSKVSSIDDFVTEAVQNEINACTLVRSKALLTENKVVLIEYLKSEFFMDPIEEFVDRVCELVNLPKISVSAFSQMYMFLERIATKMEESRKFIRSQADQNKYDQMLENSMNQNREMLDDDPPLSPPPSSQRIDPCPLLPKSMFGMSAPSPVAPPTSSYHQQPRSTYPLLYSDNDDENERREMQQEQQRQPQKRVMLDDDPPLSPPTSSQRIDPRPNPHPHPLPSMSDFAGTEFGMSASSRVAPPTSSYPRQPRRSYCMFESNNDDENERREMQQEQQRQPQNREILDDDPPLSPPPSSQRIDPRLYPRPRPIPPKSNTKFGMSAPSRIAPPTSSYPRKPRRSYCTFESNNDDENDSREMQHEQRTQPTTKKARVSFGDDAIDNEGRTFVNLGQRAVSLSIPLSDHQAIDTKHSTDGAASSGILAALPHQPTIISAPAHCVYESWQKHYNDDESTDFQEEIRGIFQQFRQNTFYEKYNGHRRNAHLVIKDSLLFPTNFNTKFKHCLEINAEFPRRMETIIDVIEQEITNRENDYNMRNIIVSMGLDLLLREKLIKSAIDNLMSFLNQFIDVIREAFNPNGPKRYKKMNKNYEGFCPVMPKIIILTIPFIDGRHPTASTFKHQISEMNKALRNFVEEEKPKLLKKHAQIIEIYDWERETKDYRKCNREDLESRFKVLTTKLSHDYQMFIAQQEINSLENRSDEENGSHGYDVQSDSEEEEDV